MNKLAEPRSFLFLQFKVDFLFYIFVIRFSWSQTMAMGFKI